MCCHVHDKSFEALRCLVHAMSEQSDPETMVLPGYKVIRSGYGEISGYRWRPGEHEVEWGENEEYDPEHPRGFHVLCGGQGEFGRSCGVGDLVGILPVTFQWKDVICVAKWSFWWTIEVVVRRLTVLPEDWEFYRALARRDGDSFIRWEEEGKALHDEKTADLFR